jgi:hypothetical protein
MVSPGSAMSQGISLVIPDGHIVRLDVQTVVLGAGVETGIVLMMLIAVLVVQIAKGLLALMGVVLLPVILFRVAYQIVAESVRAMEIHVIVIK